MPIGLNVDNPQEQNPIAAVSPTLSGANVTYGGNVLGSGSTSTTGGFTVSQIVEYGIIALAAIWILQRIDN